VRSEKDIWWVVLMEIVCFLWGGGWGGGGGGQTGHGEYCCLRPSFIVTTWMLILNTLLM